MGPGPEVLACFGASADPVPLPGGQGTAWRSGDVVLKPAGDLRVARWTADLYRDLDSLGPLSPLDHLDSLPARRDPGFRVPRPLSTVAGDGAARDWVAQDPAAGAWVAWQWLPGEPASWAGVSPFWPPLIAASRAFHAALVGRPAPPWLGRDGSQWTVGDQVAWGERDPASVLAAAPGSLAGQLRSLLAALRPVRLPAQLIHGDLGGNVLFAAGEPPAVIDFSPYWRPTGLALAVAVVDALTWSGADPAILDQLAGQPELDQLLARAHVGRLVTEVIARHGDPAGLDTVAQTGEPVTMLILSRLALWPGRPGAQTHAADGRLRLGRVSERRPMPLRSTWVIRWALTTGPRRRMLPMECTIPQHREEEIMRIRFVAKDPDSAPNQSPTLYKTDRDSWLVQGWVVADSATLAAMNILGEDIRWVPRARVSELMFPGNDFWLFDDELLVFLVFAGNGLVVDRPTKSDPGLIARCRASFGAAWALSIPHREYTPI